MKAKKTLEIKAPAKINLWLKIEGKREDGYHLLCSKMQKIALFDTLRIRLIFDGDGAEAVCFSVCGMELESVPKEKNLAYRAALIFADEYRQRSGRAVPNIDIELEKRIPMGAGLGGGSSDAAAVFRGLNELCGNPFTTEELADLGARLGADVPFFVYDCTAAMVSGIGTEVQPCSDKEGGPRGGGVILLIKPEVSLSTAAVYREYDRLLGEASEGGGGVNLPPNDLEPAALSLCPALEAFKQSADEALSELFGGKSAPKLQMSGSGSCFFTELPEGEHSTLTDFLQTKLKNFTESTKKTGIFITVVGTIS